MKRIEEGCLALLFNIRLELGLGESQEVTVLRFYGGKHSAWMVRLNNTIDNEGDNEALCDEKDLIRIDDYDENQDEDNKQKELDNVQ